MLWCNNNKLTELPLLPNSLKYLFCYNNKLTELPLLPNLNNLICDNNQLTNKPTNPLSEWIKQHNKLINRFIRLKRLLNDNR